MYLDADNYEVCSLMNGYTLDNSKYVYEDIDLDENFLISQKSETKYHTPIQLKHLLKKIF